MQKPGSAAYTGKGKRRQKKITAAMTIVRISAPLMPVFMLQLHLF
jgi:hypothetical protein